jgi:hypothetical protein
MTRGDTIKIFDELISSSALVLKIDPDILRETLHVLGSFDFAYALTLATKELGMDLLEGVELLSDKETDLTEKMKKIRALWVSPLFVN